MPAVPSKKVQKNQDHTQTVSKIQKKTKRKEAVSEKRAELFSSSPTTQDLIDAISNGKTILIEDSSFKKGALGFEAPLGDLALSLTSLTTYIIDITAVLDHFFLHNTLLNPVLCEHILTSTHEVVTNALIWSNLEVHCPNNRQKNLNFCDLIKERLKNKNLAHRPLKMNFHVNPEWVDVAIISSGKGFDWHLATSNITSDVQGLAIIHSFADEVRAEEGGKVLRLRFYV